MYKDDEYFVKPQENTCIWRYLDFTKFVDVLAQKSLFFTTVENLKKSDVYEGSLLTLERENYESGYKAYENDPDPDQRLWGYKLYKEPVDFQQIINQTTVVNCWHINDVESAAMWKIYAPSGVGLALRSTFGRFKQSIKTLLIPDLEDGKQIPLIVRIGEIAYVDFENDKPGSIPFFERIMRKAKFYKDERELRAVASVETLANTIRRTPELELFEVQLREQGGLYVPVDLDKLVECIVMAPHTPKWMQKLVKNVVSKYGLNAELVKTSSIADTR